MLKGFSRGMVFCVVGLGLAGCGEGYDCAKPEVHGTVYRLLKEPTLLPRTLLQSSNIQANPVGRALMGQWYGKTLLAASWSEREPKLRAELTVNKAKLAGYPDNRALLVQIENTKAQIANQKALCQQEYRDSCAASMRRRFPCEPTRSPTCGSIASYESKLRSLQEGQERNEQYLRNLKKQISDAEAELSAKHENIRSPGIWWS